MVLCRQPEGGKPAGVEVIAGVPGTVLRSFAKLRTKPDQGVHRDRVNWLRIRCHHSPAGNAPGGAPSSSQMRISGTRSYICVRRQVSRASQFCLRFTGHQHGGFSSNDPGFLPTFAPRWRGRCWSAHAFQHRWALMKRQRFALWRLHHHHGDGQPAALCDELKLHAIRRTRVASQLPPASCSRA